MTVEQLSHELFKIIRDDDNIMDKSIELLGERLFMYLHEDITKMPEMTYPHCNIFADGGREDERLFSFEVTFVFASVIQDADVVVDTRGQENLSSLNLSQVIDLIIKVLEDEIETGIGGEKGFEVLNTQTSNTPQVGQDDICTILRLNITQKKCL